MPRILTGIQNSGTPHLGNIKGAIQPALQLAKKQEAYFFIADLHTLTSKKDPVQQRQATYEVAATWLACGLDPKEHTLYRQSRIPEVCELGWYFNCLTPYPMLANAHAFKAKSQHLADVNAGLFTYPILMAADIALYHGEWIPVGQDQQQHLEIARDVIQRFNNQYGPILTLPQARIQPKTKTLPGLDGRKMSKSYGNTLNIFLPEAKLKKAIMRIPTASTPLTDSKNPYACIVYQLYSAIAPQEEVERMRQHYLAGNYGYGQAKQTLFAFMLDTFAEARRRYATYINDVTQLEQLLAEGEARARVVAQTTLQQVRKAMGFA